MAETAETVKEKIFEFRKYAKNFLKIKTKDKQIVPFVFNATQEILEYCREWCKQHNYLERYYMLKARQKGASTYWEGVTDHETQTNFNTKAAVIGHTTEASTNLFQMIQRFYENKPPQLKPILKNETGRILRYKLLGSEIKVLTAGVSGEGVGRSDTINVLHCTEVAFWNDPEGTLIALLQSVPDTLGTIIVIESTAFGIGNSFYNGWQEIYTNPNRVEIIPNVAWYSPESGYIGVFISWLIDDEYTLPIENEGERALIKQTLSATEQTLLKQGATYGHLKWRRKTIFSKFGHDEEKFKQEYPSTPEEAFLVSGRPVFDSKICYENLLECDNHQMLKGNLVPVYDETNKDYAKTINYGRTGYYDLLPFLKDVKFVPDNNGYITIYDPADFPEIVSNEYCRFAAGWDIAEGLAQGDFTDGAYLDRKTMKVLLTWHGHIDPDLVADEQHKIEYFLNRKVYTCTERNNHGITVLNSAFKLNVLQYFQEEFRTGMIENTDSLGFRTTQQSKPVIINDLNEYIREFLFKDFDKGFWGESLTFVKNEKGQMQAQGKDKDPSTKCFDDRIISRALMIKCHKWMPNYTVIQTEPTETERQQAHRLHVEGEAEWASY